MQKIINEVFDTHLTNGAYDKTRLAKALIKVLEGLPIEIEHGVGEYCKKYDIDNTTELIRKKGG